MSRYDLYTAIIGILSVCFSLSVAVKPFPFEAKIFFVFVGAIIFFHSAWILYRALTKRNSTGKIISDSDEITQITLLNEKGQGVTSWELYGRTSAVIGKDLGNNFVDIDLSKSPYAAMIDVEHAVLNYAGGNWYVEDLNSENGISVKKFDKAERYKLSVSQPCKLDFGDIIFVGMCQLKLN